MPIFSRTPEGDSTFCGDPLWSAKFMYALGSAGASSILNFLPVFYEDAGFNKVQIGYLQTLPCICFMVGPPFWGLIGDRFQSPRAIYNVCVLSGAALMYVCQFFTDFYWVALMIVLSFFQSTPAGSFLDMIILDLIDKYGGEYGKQRLFGAVGWGLAAYIAGMLVATFGLSWAFNLNMIYGVGTVLMLRAVPDPRRKVEGYSEIESGKEAETGPQTIGDSIRLIFHQVDVLVLLCVVFLMGLMYGVLSSFLTLNLYNLSGYDPRIIGIAIMCETTSELPAFFFADKLINKVGTVNVLLISIAGYAARITFYAFMTDAWTAIPFEFLHGVTFALAWTAVTQYVYAAAPKGCEGTMMGMLNSAQNGVGRGCGTLIGGYLWEKYNPRTMWLVTDMGVPLSIVGVFLFACLKENIDAKKAEQASIVTGKKSPATYDSVN